MRLSFLTFLFFGCLATSANAELILDPERCQSEAKKVGDLISASNVCASDADCVMGFFGCPWGCGSVINRSKREEIEAAVAQYNSQGCGVCKYRCQARELPPRPGCRNNRCVDLSRGQGRHR